MRETSNEDVCMLRHQHKALNLMHEGNYKADYSKLFICEIITQWAQLSNSIKMQIR